MRFMRDWSKAKEREKCEWLGIDSYPGIYEKCRERWKELVRSMPREEFTDAMAISRAKYYGWLADRHQSHYKVPTTIELQRACWITGYSPTWVMFGVGVKYLKDCVQHDEGFGELNSLLNTLEVVTMKVEQIGSRYFKEQVAEKTR